ncbi:ABC transporter permease [Pseudonocardia eucalypti]|uniref:ABC transporter permease n=1 Tax=Pseudonocardia eucalypti TaxID=648755 RepID=A0ABP9QPI5_9PSEU|nr:putative spermidine/putrescine transport system permease protein [Pseudonocardia eucalypti]
MTAVIEATPVARSSPVRRFGHPGYLLVPAAALLLVIFFVPLARIAWRSFTDPVVGLDNYHVLLVDGVSLTVLGRTLVTAAVVSAVCLVLVYPYAYAMTRVSARVRGLLVLLVLLPFWTSMMARNFAWYVLEQRDGLIDRLFSVFGVRDVVLLGSATGVAVAMVQVMLPFMALPLYTSLAGIDRRLLDAAMSCGAPWFRAFRTVYLPLSVPGVVSGFSLVFIMSLGFYVTPAILGSPQQALASQLIQIRVATLLDFGAAGALGMVLLALTLAALVVVWRIGRGGTLDRAGLA